MRFGPMPLDGAEGVVLAHAVALPDGRIAKGTSLGVAELDRLRRSGLATVVGATLEEGDLPENEAAAAIGEILVSKYVRAAPAATGRVNLFAETNGVFVVDRALVDRLNAVDPAITLATLPEFVPVVVGQMVATVKIIPLAVSGASIAAARAVVGGASVFRAAAYRSQRIVLVQTELPSLKVSALAKTRHVLEGRLAPSGSVVIEERHCRHETNALANALSESAEADLVIVFGASAIIDAEDVVPAAIRQAGGEVQQIGMPVDPGNLLLLGRFRDRPILGAPGCARSPKENGFDWILNRLLADVPVLPQDVRCLGVGGLLSEIPSRPQPRHPATRR